MPDTSPPAPRLATSEPSSAVSKVTGPRLETRTIGRSDEGVPIGATVVTSIGNDGRHGLGSAGQR